MLATLLSLGLGVVTLAPTTAGAADLRRLESVGVVPLRTGDRGGAPRDAAVQAAVARGVERVAKGLLAGPPPGADEAAERGKATELDPALAAALGSDPFEYVSRFRILRDRGLRDPLLSRDPDVDREYVVEAEVTVDADRIRDRLREAGWLQARAVPAGPGLRLVIEKLHSYAAYAGLRRSLIDDLGVRAAVPVEFTRGRGVLAVETSHDANSLIAALEQRGNPNLRVVPLEQQGDVLTVLVDWVGPPPGPAAPDSDDDSSAN